VAAVPTEARQVVALPLDVRRSVALPGAVGLLLALLVVGLHMAQLGADPSVFVRAAPPFGDPQRVPRSLHLLQPEQVYDGQFFYRLALDPGLSRDVGISLDKPAYRQQRLLYPLLARLLALGQDDWVPTALLALNVFGLGLLGVLGARYALDLGRPAWWGVALPLYAGFAFSLARDLAEIVQGCLLVGSLLAIQRGRPVWAAGLLALAVLTRETAVILAVALLASGLWSRIRPGFRRGPGADGLMAATASADCSLVAGAAGLGCYLLVQAVLGLRWGAPPLLAGSANLAWPLSGPWQYLLIVGHLGWLEVGWFAALVAAALLTRARGAPIPSALRLGLLGFVGLLVSLSWLVWSGDAAWLRAGTEACLLAWLVLFHGDPRRVHLAIVATAALWPAVARWAIAT
jgi:hypothetical protein